MPLHDFLHVIKSKAKTFDIVDIARWDAVEPGEYFFTVILGYPYAIVNK